MSPNQEDGWLAQMQGLQANLATEATAEVVQLRARVCELERRMQSSPSFVTALQDRVGAPSTGTLKLNAIPAMGWKATGLRAVVEFTPKPASGERLIAGVVTKLDGGEVDFSCAIDPRKMEHAFGAEGLALYHAAYRLCDSLADHWRTRTHAEEWTPPFTGARLAEVARFTAQTPHEAHRLMLDRTSTLHMLLNRYEIPLLIK